MWERGPFCRRLPSPTPPPLSLPRFSTLSNPSSGPFLFCGNRAHLFERRLVRLTLIPPNAVNVTGILRARGIDARRTRHKSHAQPCLWPVWEHPKDEHEKQRLCVRKHGKTLSQVPSRSFFPMEKELPEKNRNNFSFRFFASLFCVHHDSFFTIKIYFSYASCSFSQKIMLFQ